MEFPLVSAIMPTRGRQDMAREALECAIVQTYEPKELVIVDDSDDPSFTEEQIRYYTVSHGAQIHYHRLKARLTIGAKRNLACSRANGDILIHFDSDDWSAAGRMADQVTRLQKTGADLTGFNSMKFYHVEADQWYRYHGNPTYCIGSSMAYRREFWKANPFPDVSIGEDNAVSKAAGKVALVDANDLMYARTHAGCTDNREGFGEGSCWVKL